MDIFQAPFLWHKMGLSHCRTTFLHIWTYLVPRFVPRFFGVLPRFYAPKIKNGAQFTNCRIAKNRTFITYFCISTERK